ncbi:MAG: hypothetical protein ING66_11925 [Rhodocyclaceae bacterium]|nr:hypothetical protein [Rhodocyclaceae bacterium]MCA3059476.1 hypothetical protein [Rhodocyclaceae bacterium]
MFEFTVSTFAWLSAAIFRQPTCYRQPGQTPAIVKYRAELAQVLLLKESLSAYAAVSGEDGTARWVAFATLTSQTA